MSAPQSAPLSRADVERACILLAVGPFGRDPAAICGQLGLSPGLFLVVAEAARSLVAEGLLEEEEEGESDPPRFTRTAEGGAWLADRLAGRGSEAPSPHRPAPESPDDLARRM